MSRHVLITGASGFLGSHLCDLYIARGWRVTGLDNELAGRRENIAHLLGNPAFSYQVHDICDGLPDDGRPLDLILHLASLASPPFYKRLQVETLMVGAIGTRNALELATLKGARILFSSTSEVYGDPLESPQSESYWGNVNPIGPRSMYDESKRFAEALMVAYQKTRGTNVAIVRIFNTYGPRLRPDDGRVVTEFLGQILDGKPLTVHGDGTQTRSFCYVGDLVDGIARMADSTHTGPVNLGNPHEEMSILALAERLCRVFDAPFNRSGPLPPQDENDPRRRRPDISLARTLLGWEPRTTFEDGMRATYDYLKTLRA